MSKIKITEVYCIELDEVIDIDRAHEESLKDGLPYKRFNFLCSDDKCRKLEVKVTGVNYDKPVSQQQNVMHFRENFHYKHHPDCEWALLDAYLTYPGIHTGESAKLSEIRKQTYSTVTDWIMRYTPYVPDIGVRTENNITVPVTKKTTNSSYKPEEKTHLGNHGRTTHSFHKICQFHYEMNVALADYKKLQEIPLYVANIGETNLYKYFQVIKYGLKFDKTHEYDCILFGQLAKQNGKYVITKYGIGFRIKFLAKISGMDITVYISSQQILNYRHRNALIDVLDNHEKFDNLTAYLIPKPNIVTSYQHKFGRKEIQITISDLNYFRLIGTPIKE